MCIMYCASVDGGLSASEDKGKLYNYGVVFLV